MNRPEGLDAVVVGSGPNGLAAAIVLAAAGLRVRLYEEGSTLGGGCRTAELTLPGYAHDVCSAVHPLAEASPFFQRFGLEARSVRLLHPDVAFAQPLDGGQAAVAFNDLERTADELGADGRPYRRLFAPLVEHAPDLAGAVLSSLREVPDGASHLVSFAVAGMRSVEAIVRRFEGARARALLGGVAAHAMRPLDAPLTGGIALFLASLAHGVGWPLVEGGSERIVDAMADDLKARGVEVATSSPVRSLAELPPSRAVLLDVSPLALASIAKSRLPERYLRGLRRFRYGPGTCKVDWALDGPVPWQAEACRKAGTLHLGGTFEELASAEAEVAAGRHPEKPYVLAVQPGVVDRSRAPDGKATLWTYCHVPAGSDVDMSEAVASQIERFAPGFRDLVLERAVRTAKGTEEENPNCVGGDIACGAQSLRQTLFRPVARWSPHRLPLRGVYLCSSATPPGPGVHGRCGELAARSALEDLFGIEKVEIGPAAP